jgi:hypothetical protein
VSLRQVSGRKAALSEQGAGTQFHEGFLYRQMSFEVGTGKPQPLADMADPVVFCTTLPQPAKDQAGSVPGGFCGWNATTRSSERRFQSLYQLRYRYRSWAILPGV